MSSSPKPAPGLTVAGRVVRVIDGDTLEFEATRRIRVRLLDCWAPESRTRDLDEKARGLAAKEHLQQLIDECADGVLFIPAAKEGDVSEIFTLGRVLGQVWRGDDPQSLAELQVAGGFATRSRE